MDAVLKIAMEDAEENRNILPDAFLHPEDWDKEWIETLKKENRRSIKASVEDIAALTALKERHTDDEELSRLISECIALQNECIQNDLKEIKDAGKGR